MYDVYGMPIGGFLMVTLWQNKIIIMEKVFFNGTQLISFSGINEKMMFRFYWNITHKMQQRDKKTLKQAVKNIISKENLAVFLKTRLSGIYKTIKYKERGYTGQAIHF